MVLEPQVWTTLLYMKQKLNFQILFIFKNCNEILILNKELTINNFDDIKLFSSALWLYEFKFQMVSRYSTLVQFQSGTRKFVLYTLSILYTNIYCIFTDILLHFTDILLELLGLLTTKHSLLL